MFNGYAARANPMLAAVLMAWAGSLPAAAQDVTPPQVSTCQSCHGVNGNSTRPEVPRLNGQTAEYLAARLKSLRDPTRQSVAAIHAMWDLANHIGDDDIQALARYYAAQTPSVPDRRASRLMTEGRRLYQKGVGNVPSCQSCHGANGEGNGAVSRLAGQHAKYLDYQLTAFSYTMRYHPGMDRNTMYLTQPEIDALVAYLAKD
ncbi:MAG TPA: c-type cytochrome [Rhizomicrobium sp.]